MRARVEANGILSLADHEIIEYLLYPFVPRKDTNPIAHALIDRFGSFNAVLKADISALESVDNVTHAAALFLTSLSDVARKFCNEENAFRPMVDTYEHAAEYLGDLLGSAKEEHIVALFVDASGKLIQKCELGEGNNADCHIRVSELVMLTLNFKARFVYLAHNHPEGGAKPSFSDVEFTKWAVAALEVLGVRLVDHIIVAGKELFSFRKEGNMDRFKSGYIDYLNNGSMMTPPGSEEK